MVQKRKIKGVSHPGEIASSIPVKWSTNFTGQAEHTPVPSAGATGRAGNTEKYYFRDKAKE